jgi:hypothetical protein
MHDLRNYAITYVMELDVIFQVNRSNRAHVETPEAAGEAFVRTFANLILLLITVQLPLHAGVFSGGRSIISAILAR